MLGDLSGHGKTVIRGGYSRICGRLNGVGFGHRSCEWHRAGASDPLHWRHHEWQVPGQRRVNPNTAFRISTDGMSAPLPPVSQTLSQLYFPGVGGNASAGDGGLVDPKFKPNHSSPAHVPAFSGDLPGLSFTFLKRQTASSRATVGPRWALAANDWRSV
jgi:hypothetical protein